MLEKTVRRRPSRRRQSEGSKTRSVHRGICRVRSKGPRPDPPPPTSVGGHDSTIITTAAPAAPAATSYRRRQTSPCPPASLKQPINRISAPHLAEGADGP